MSQSFARIVFGVTAAFFAAFFPLADPADSQGRFSQCRWPPHLRLSRRRARRSTYLAGLRNSFLLACATTALALAIALPLAVISDRFIYPGKGLLGSVVLIPMILPPFVGAIGIKQIFGQYGALNALIVELGLRPHGWTFDWFAANQFWASRWSRRSRSIPSST